MANFKVETEACIKSLLRDKKISSSEIDEIYITRSWYDYSPDDASVGDLVYIQKGGPGVDWNKLKEELKLDSFEYNDGYGGEVFRGWITFKDKNAWIIRREYDGSEWWDSVSRPMLTEESD